MLLASGAAALVALSAALAGLTVASLLRAQSDVRDLEDAAVRQRTWRTEQTRFVSTRTRIAEVATTTSDVVQLGSAITQTGHRAIAAIPFGILGVIPPTREASQRVRAVHDGTADRVYDGIASVVDRISTALRQRLVGLDD